MFKPRQLFSPRKKTMEVIAYEVVWAPNWYGRSLTKNKLSPKPGIEKRFLVRPNFILIGAISLLLQYYKNLFNQ